jgi:hypothetical protein
MTPCRDGARPEERSLSRRQVSAVVRRFHCRLGCRRGEGRNRRLGIAQLPVSAGSAGSPDAKRRAGVPLREGLRSGEPSDPNLRGVQLQGAPHRGWSAALSGRSHARLSLHARPGGVPRPPARARADGAAAPIPGGPPRAALPAPADQAHRRARRRVLEGARGRARPGQRGHHRRGGGARRHQLRAPEPGPRLPEAVPGRLLAGPERALAARTALGGADDRTRHHRAGGGLGHGAPAGPGGAARRALGAQRRQELGQLPQRTRVLRVRARATRRASRSSPSKTWAAARSPAA